MAVPIHPSASSFQMRKLRTRVGPHLPEVKWLDGVHLWLPSKGFHPESSHCITQVYHRYCSVALGPGACKGLHLPEPQLLSPVQNRGIDANP